MNPERVDELGLTVLDALEELDAPTLRLLGEGLMLDGGALAALGYAVDGLADDGQPDVVARLRMRMALRAVAGDDELVGRLAKADGSIWRAVAAAAAEIAGASGAEADS